MNNGIKLRIFIYAILTLLFAAVQLWILNSEYEIGPDKTQFYIGTKLDSTYITMIFLNYKYGQGSLTFDVWDPTTELEYVEIDLPSNLTVQKITILKGEEQIEQVKGTIRNTASNNEDTVNYNIELENRTNFNSQTKYSINITFNGTLIPEGTYIFARRSNQTQDVGHYNLDLFFSGYGCEGRCVGIKYGPYEDLDWQGTHEGLVIKTDNDYAYNKNRENEILKIELDTKNINVEENKNYWTIIVTAIYGVLIFGIQEAMNKKSD
ncbi:hypothetical protein KKF81_05660 [Candidatus Micrarchaeota archaeon]|nr:hypothetical protein [Candidatus Micrarchaeota archaeon]MBU1166415.1 hypothetical protein [Candidatus Micrarchaeota archaeon]MBU1886902.1 hypothetical protein [Candidatus Micrarchaeota archaeon]